ncbi:COP23 domain-containing protein [Waterburya agarophytonicola K14]|uniref:COP23 domain-containing protein n=1 Tax=Waterburya agarophytonicola KI4 TaxID=2874699 RepID=A0A964BST4_9CYAN|nr:COP23 domain-containing protein [Waterburya agarophytonicola]MCC0177878.1 COP23 domain-containing protein [Waterburya agarophytonicola KI4]
MPVLNTYISTLSIVGIIFSSFLTNIKPSIAQDRFFCDENGLFTSVNTERGALPLIRWSDRSFPPPFSPAQRCQIVSQRFQKFDSNGTLKYIKADMVNNLPALCVAAYLGGKCLPDGLLVTFKPGTDANKTLIKLLDQRVWAARETISLSGNSNDSIPPEEKSVISQVNGTTYINMELFLNWNNEPQK